MGMITSAVLFNALLLCLLCQTLGTLFCHIQSHTVAMQKELHT